MYRLNIVLLSLYFVCNSSPIFSKQPWPYMCIGPDEYWWRNKDVLDLPGMKWIYLYHSLPVGYWCQAHPITFNFRIIDGHIEFPYYRLFFDKSNKRSIKLEIAVTWSKSNLNMMNIYEESTLNFWICGMCFGMLARWSCLLAGCASVC